MTALPKPAKGVPGSCSRRAPLVLGIKRRYIRLVRLRGCPTDAWFDCAGAQELEQVADNPRERVVVHAKIENQRDRARTPFVCGTGAEEGHSSARWCGTWTRAAPPVVTHAKSRFPNRFSVSQSVFSTSKVALGSIGRRGQRSWPLRRHGRW